MRKAIWPRRFFLLVWMVLVMTPISGTASAADSDVIELHPHGHYPPASSPPDLHPILFQIPQKFRYGSTRNTSRTWEIQILTYYPSFDSPSDPSNRDNGYGLDCAGICNGRVFITVEYRINLANTQSPNMGDAIARAELKFGKTPPYPPNVTVRDLGPQNGFDEGFERVTFMPNTPSDQPPQVARKETTLFRKAADGQHYDLTATCHVAMRTTCILHFSLSCNPAIYISVSGLDISYLDQSADIADKTDKFILGMVRTPSCK